MNKTIAWLWTLAFSLQLASCICGSEPLWVNVLVPIICLMLNSWLEVFKDRK